MKIDVGNYARVKGYIGKICNINEFREPSMEIWIDIPQANDVVFCSREDITKASDDITDLIEVGDYVNGHRVDYISQGELIYFEHTYYGEDSFHIELPIKSIVTKEQFEAKSYKVGEWDGYRTTTR